MNPKESGEQTGVNIRNEEQLLTRLQEIEALATSTNKRTKTILVLLILTWLLIIVAPIVRPLLFSFAIA